MRAVEDSLRRLGTDWIDLYQVHRPEPDTDIEETLGALTDLVRAGKIRYVGSSTFPAHADGRGPGTSAAARPRAAWPSSRRTRSWPRGIEREVLPVGEQYGMGVLAWSPLAGGWLSGRYRRDKPGRDRRRAEPGPVRHDLAENQAKLERPSR